MSATSATSATSDSARPRTDAPIQVAILGGGCGAMAAAFELTATEELRRKYAVTVYQQGWRLGGKGASGRNAAACERIEEHGLHMWMGWYENAFRMMRDCYAEWRRSPQSPFQSIDDAFKPSYQLSIAERTHAHPGWHVWNIPLPPAPGEPGRDGRHVGLEELLERGIRWLEARLGEVVERVEARRWHGWPGLLLGDRHPELVAAQTLIGTLRLRIARAHPTVLHGIIGAIARFLDWVVGEVEHTVDEIPLLRHLVLLLRLGGAVLIGFISDVLPHGEQGFARIDRHDFKDWLEQYTSPEVAWSAPVQAFYDMAFAYEDGIRDREHARASAGAVLHTILLMVLGYKKAPLWKMQAGMGDTVFTPLYQVLRARGVRFEFFHRVHDLGLSEDGNWIDRIELRRQARTVGDAPYRPLRPVQHLDCWPSEPLWEQIEGGERLRDELHEQGLTLESAWCSHHVETRVLELGRDFDLVVLGISVAALKDVCPELIERAPGWREMVEATRTVQTLALQLWLTPDLEQLGWTHGETVMTAYASPFASWGEMSDLRPRADWPTRGPSPHGIEYLCGVLPDATPIPPFTDAGFPAREHARVERYARAWLSRYPGLIWPLVCNEKGGLDWGRLYDPQDRRGEARLDWQYFRANVDPTERYVLTVPGSIPHRMEAGGSGILNLYLAGDWVRTRVNAGCVEGAVEGGMRCARAICGSPEHIAGD